MKSNLLVKFAVVVLIACQSSLTAAQTLGSTCNTAISISCGNASITGSTVGLPSDNASSGAGACFNTTSTGGQMWYSLNTDEDLSITLNTCSPATNFDTYLSVYTGECGALTCIASNDDGCSNLKSNLSFSASSDATYLIRVGGFSNASGTFLLNISCQPDLGGCMDSMADNYDPEAIFDDGSCIFSGCTDPNAFNYDPDANQDDGSCYYCENGGVSALLYVCALANGDELNLEIMDSEGSSVISISGLNDFEIAYFDLCLQEGECYTAIMTNSYGLTGWYNGYFWINANNTLIINQSLNANLTSEIALFSVDGTCTDVAGCTDATAINYNPNATIDDGTCIYSLNCEGLTTVNLNLTPGIFPFEVSYNITNEAGEVVYIGTAWNSESANASICLADGCYGVNMFDSFGDGWNNAFLTVEFNGSAYVFTFNQGTNGYGSFGINTEGCTNSVVTGCTDPGALNYNEDATVDDGSCQYTIYGCTDPEALNFNAFATVDDGSCFYSEDCEHNIVTLMISTQIWGSEVSWNLLNENGEEVASGSGYSSWSYYLSYLCLPDGCYTLVMNDSWGDGWNGAYYMIYGADFYAEGSLLYGSSSSDLISIGAPCAIDGCTDPEAINYNPAATVDDGSCFYNQNGGGNVFGGMVGQVLGIATYPNPTSDMLIVNLHHLLDDHGLQLNIMSVDGKIVYAQSLANNQTQRIEEINVSDFESGYYLLQVINGEQSKVVTFIKE